MKNALLTFLLLGASFTFRAQAPGGVSSGLTIWLNGDAGTSSTTSGANLSYWNDQSGNGNNATQATASKQPTLITNVLNGHNAMVSNGGARFFNVNLLPIDNHAFTIFTLIKRNSALTNQFVMGTQMSTPNPGLHIGYVANTRLRHGQYGTKLNRSVLGHQGALESPRLIIADCKTTFAQSITEVFDGVKQTSTNANTNHYASTAQGVIGRGSSTVGLSGYIAEVIVYNRVLTAVEIRQVQTYLSVKYGLTILVADHLYYNETSYPHDIFGIGRQNSQSLNQTNSSSENYDDILRVMNPSNLGDGEYLIFGNQNGAQTFSPYVGSNCQITSKMARTWKAKETGEVGTTTLRFDMTGITGFNSERLMLLVDHDADGFDDETGISGTYNAPYFDVTGVNLANGETFTLGEGVTTWYVVASGNTSGAIWSHKPNGTPQVVSSMCPRANVVLQTGFTATSDWATLTCAEFLVQPGGIFNAGSTAMTLSGDLDNNGIFNAQSSSITMNGTVAQNIEGSGITNVYNFTSSNAAGITISAGGGGVRARNVVQINAGTLQTNNKLTLMSDASSSGMIGPLTTGDVVGNITINRYHSATQGWFGLCSPIQNKTISDWNDDLITTGFVGSDYPPPYPFTNVQYYNESVAGGMNDGFAGVTNITNSILARKGYFIYANSGSITVDVDGQFFKGDQLMDIAYTNTGNASGDGWNYIANPYPSTIDWDSPAWTKTNMDNAVYVWNAATGQYATYLNGVSSNGGSRYIPHSQAFFVKANAASPALTARENCKSNLQGAFKSTTNPDEVLTLTISNGTYTDETTLAKNESGSLHFEGTLDAYKLRSPLEEVPYLSSISTDGDEMSINSFNDFTEETVISLRVEAGVSGTYDFSHTGLSTFSKGACIVLEDLLTGNTYPLNQYESIPLELVAGSDEIRFQLRMMPSALANVTSAGCPGLSQGSAMVQLGDSGSYDITWINPDGEIIYHESSVSGTSEISGLAPGFYTLQIGNNGVCGTTETTFLVSSDDAVNATALILPATCDQLNNGGIALKIEGGSAPYQVTWSNGATTTSLENLSSGEYTAFITDINGCDGSYTFSVPATESVLSSFETQDQTYVLHNGAVTVDFFNTSENAGEFHWNFGDNTIAIQDANPQHLFNAVGIYTVSLTARNGDCESVSTKTIRIENPKTDITDFTSSIIGQLTDNGVQLMFFFDDAHQLRINAYNVLGQQLIEPITGTYTRQTITFSDRRYASNALIEVTDLTTGERAILRMGR